MQVQLPIFFLTLLVHIAVYLTSNQKDKRVRMTAGLTMLFITYPVWFAGLYFGTSDQPVYRWLIILMVRAPYYLPFLSFLVYFRRGNNSVRR